eukprot:scaffold1414_cov175-Skeletonema_marinoi.AAC.4
MPIVPTSKDQKYSTIVSIQKCIHTYQAFKENSTIEIVLQPEDDHVPPQVSLRHSGGGCGAAKHSLSSILIQLQPGSISQSPAGTASSGGGANFDVFAAQWFF